jgi:TIR domain
VFISHAHEDKDGVARPLAQRLTQLGVRVWLDENELELGDSLWETIDHGLVNSRFGIVILSPAFFSKSRFLPSRLNRLQSYLP